MLRTRVGLRSKGFSGARSLFPTDGSPSLILDFVPTAGTDGLSLDLNFISQSYASFQPDPQTGGLTLFQVWS